MQILITLINWLSENSSCSFKERFDLYCPGCGCTRAAKYLLELDILNSFLANPMIIIVTLVILLCMTIAIYERVKFHYSKKLRILRAKILGAFLIMWFLYAIVRNLLLVCGGIDYLGDFYS